MWPGIRKEEFAERRRRLAEALPPDTVALLHAPPPTYVSGAVRATVRPLQGPAPGGWPPAGNKGERSSAASSQCVHLVSNCSSSCHLPMMSCLSLMQKWVRVTTGLQ